MIHALVTPKTYFDEVVSGARTADIKKDDRPYKKGDSIILQEFDGDKRLYTGREVTLTITTITRNVPREGLRRGFAFICFSAGIVVENEMPEGYGAQPKATETEEDETPETGTESTTVEVDSLKEIPEWMKGGDKETEVVTDKTAMSKVKGGKK